MLHIGGRSAAAAAAESSSVAAAERISFYKSGPPAGDMALEELEKCALDRFAVLHAFSVQRAKSASASATAATSQAEQERVRSLASTTLPLQTADDVRRDVASHHVLRLAFARTEENRKWFVKQERALLLSRLHLLPSSELASFMRANGLGYNCLTEADFAKLRDAIETVELSKRRSGSVAAAAAASRTNYYRVPFEEALDLVKTRDAVLADGDAIVGIDRLFSVICGRFRAVLSQAMAAASRAWPLVAPRLARLGPIFEFTSRRIALPSGPTPAAFAAGGACSLADIPTLCARSFPPCMRRLHDALERDNHLRHWGRMQYALFLKGIGLPLEDTLQLWTSKFSHYAQSDAKLRPYLYTVRHIYGKEGKGVDYTPYGCLKIITFQVPPGEFHGCPLCPQHLPPEQMQQELVRIGTPAADIEDIMQIASAGHCQVACGRYFLSTHKGMPQDEVAINHPNQFTALSRKFWAQKVAPSASDKK